MCIRDRPLTENMLVLNVDSINSKLRVQREFNGVVGIMHSEGQVVTVTNRSITFNTIFDSDIVTNVNVPYYFNPVESVALGSTAGVGVGSTVRYTYKVAGNKTSSTFVPTQQIFLQGHKFATGQRLLYSNGGGDSLSVYNGISTFNLPNNSFVFAINEGDNFLGLSTDPIAGIGTTGNLIGIGSTAASTGIGSTAYRLFYSGHGTGTKHSLKPQKEEITGFIEKVVGTVVCKENHGLLQNDKVSISLTPGITTSYQVEYDDLTKRTIINPKSFGSSGVNTTTSLFTINDHRFETGDKILYKSLDPVPPLVSNDVSVSYTHLTLPTKA